MATVKAVFHAFERVFGPIGAAKSLHLLPPHFFPQWNRDIAGAYGLPLGQTGANGERYWQFMFISRGQGQDLGDDLAADINLLKAIDEYNYCHFTRRLRSKRSYLREFLGPPDHQRPNPPCKA